MQLSTHGLTAFDTIRQSRAIHPDWDEHMIREHMINDEFFEEWRTDQAIALAKKEGVL